MTLPCGHIKKATLYFVFQQVLELQWSPLRIGDSILDSGDDTLAWRVRGLSQAWQICGFSSTQDHGRCCEIMTAQ